MRNEFTNFKMYLQFLFPLDQIFNIDLFIDDLINNNNPSNSADKKYAKIKELKKLRHDIILNNAITNICADIK